jgi:hypothetical protein
MILLGVLGWPILTADRRAVNKNEATSRAGFTYKKWQLERSLRLARVDGVGGDARL